MPRFEAANLQRGHKHFTLVHYGVPVTYETDGFVEKNKDDIPRGASKLLKSSSKDFVKLLGMMMDDSAEASGGASDSDSPRASAKRYNLQLQVNSRCNSTNFAPVLTQPCHITFAVSNQTNR
jgi:myosin-5